MKNSLAWIDDELRRLESQHLRRELRTFSGPRGVVIQHGESALINFGSNDYLNLAGDPCLAQAVIDATKNEGWGAAASPLITGRSSAHQLLESRIAEFESAAAALVFSSGFAANLGTIAALVGKGDLIFSDQRNHASIVDGCRLSGAKVVVYNHASASDLERQLASAEPARRKLIVTDSIFSMDGDLAPLAEIATIAERFDAMLMVDEAHATGVFGEHGRGLCEHLGIEDRVPVRVGTLSKALGCAGGFVVGAKPLIDWLANRARPYVFSTAHPAATYAAAICALDIIRAEPERRQQLLDCAAELRRTLRDRGWYVGQSESQIIPLIIEDPKRTMELAAMLQNRGLLVPGIRPPSVPPGESLLRISLSSGHTTNMIDQLLDALGTPPLSVSVNC